MSVEVHAELGSLAPIESGWRELAEARGNAFLTPEWMRAWLAHYGERVDPVIAVVRNPDGELRGVLPLVRLRAGAATVLRFAGFNFGDVFSPACASGDEGAVASEAMGALAERGAWGAALLDHVEADSPWPRSSASAAGLRAGAPYRNDVLPMIDLPGSWEDYMASRSRNFRSQVGRKTRALERDFEAEFRRADADTLQADLATLYRLHERRWQGRGGSGALAERPSRFHSQFAAAALERGWLRLWTLSLDGEAVAAWYGWRLGDRYSYYQAGFDPRFEKQSVGLVLLARTIRDAAEEGAAVYDLLRGGETYKARFATGERPVHTIALARPGSIARLATAAESAAWRAGQRMTPDRREKARALYARLERFTPGARGR